MLPHHLTPSKSLATQLRRVKRIAVGPSATLWQQQEWRLRQDGARDRKQ